MKDTHRVTRYTTDFDRICYQLPDWSDRPKAEAFYRGLAPRIKNSMALSTVLVPRPSTLSKLSPSFSTRTIGNTRTSFLAKLPAKALAPLPLPLPRPRPLPWPHPSQVSPRLLPILTQVAWVKMVDYLRSKRNVGTKKVHVGIAE